MAQDACSVVSGEDRVRFGEIVALLNRAHKHVLRGRIVLHSAERLSVAEVARRTGPRPAGGQTAINPYLAEHNCAPKPVVWSMRHLGI
jgi:hypothetical protein